MKQTQSNQSNLHARSLIAGRRRRLLKVYHTTFSILFTYGRHRLVTAIRGHGWSKRTLPDLHRRSAHRVLATILDVQGLFIKIGQLVSILSNFLPAEFREDLEALQDRIPPRPFAEIKDQLTTELGRPLEDVFSTIEKEPLASASLAQVHAGRLADGQQVAIKVQHRDIERLAQMDLNTVRRVLQIVEFVVRLRGLDTLFQEVRDMILEELDFRQEANHLELIAKGFANEPRVDCPQLFREFSTSKILVTELVEGTKVTDLAALKERHIDPVHLAERLVHAYCRMIFVEGTYHADPHPGNILITDDGRIVFIDFGAVGRLSTSMKDGLLSFFTSALKRDEKGILAALKRMGFVPYRTNGEVAEELINYVYSRFFDEIALESWNLEDITFDPRIKFEMIADLNNLDITMRELTATFQVPRAWILLERTLLLLLGVAHQLHPQMKPASLVGPYLEELVLGPDRDWVSLVGSTVRDLGLAAIALPLDFRNLLHRANRGELQMEVHGLREGSRLLYSLGHQLILGGFALGSSAMAVFTNSTGDTELTQILLLVTGASLLLLGISIWKTRRLSKRLRRKISGRR